MKEEVSKKRARKQPRNRWSAWGILLAIFMAMTSGLYLLNGFIVKALGLGPGATILNANDAISMTMVAIQIITWIIFVGLAFNYLRKNRIGKEQAMAVALIDAVGTVILMIPLSLLDSYFYSTTTPMYFTLMAMPFAFIFSILITYLVARIFQWRYDRKYNFAVE